MYHWAQGLVNRLVSFTLALLVSCRATSFSDVDASSDASTIDAGTDAAVTDAGPACDVKKPFGAPKAIDGLGNMTQAYVGGQLSSDGLTAWFGRYPPMPSDLFFATRLTNGGAFGAAMNMPFISGNKASGRAYPTLTENHLTVIYVDADPNSQQLWVSTRTSDAVAFPPETMVFGNMGTMDSRPHLSADGSVLYFDRVTNKGAKIYRSARQGNTYGVPSIVAGLDTWIGYGMSPVPTSDDLTLYFASNTGSGVNVFVSHRATITSAFDTPVTVDELSSTEDDLPMWLSPDQCVMLLSRAPPPNMTFSMPYMLEARRPR